MTERRKLIIVGDRAFAEVACLYFRLEGRFDVAGFAVHERFRQGPDLMGLPVLAIEDLATAAPPETHDAFVAVTYGKLNRVRRALCDEMKGRGYRLASYVSPHAFVAPGVEIGENVFIFENNVVQPFVKLGNDVVLWSGNHIGHHSVIEDDVFISSHVVVSGYCHIGRSSFIGVNTAIADQITIAPDCWIGPGCVISKSTNKGEIHQAPASEISRVSAHRFFRVPDA
jgi:sugar O-acyltransferase (sialic acid O-acetyltransferase NeuD family)